MDILMNNISLLIILGVIFLAFVTYSTTIIRKHGTKTYLRQLGRGSVFIFVLLGKFLIKAVGFLAQSAKSNKSGKESDIAPSGGVLNYRTGKLDDGTDPVGWYEKD
jgi:hypothetical protein